MIESVASKVGKDGISEQPKKLYTTPMLKPFGRLSRLTQGSGGSGNDAGGAMTMKSDRNIKHNIIQVADLPVGVGLYLFDYLPEYCDTTAHGRQLGVMADEVEKVMPEAVSVHASGYKMVNYGLLDIRANDVASAFIH
jgi:hypothetical protein